MPQPILLVVNGELPPAAALRKLRTKSASVVSTDGAAEELFAHQIIPEVIIGDLDSLSPKMRAELECRSKIIEKPSQYATDFEKALDYIEGKGKRRVQIVGLKGKRFDHQLTNVSILLQNASRFDFELYDDDGYGKVISGPDALWRQKLSAGTVVSLLPLNQCAGVTTSGLRYPLNSDTLQFGLRNGQSNVSLGNGEVSIEIQSGTLIVYVLHRHWWRD
ncbi:MAG: thiamine diphosphokinase [Bdellovibrionales bacterium]|nr:thiamine diphosphokinase [Bdellovibrionales bacterium]